MVFENLQVLIYSKLHEKNDVITYILIIYTKNITTTTNFDSARVFQLRPHGFSLKKWVGREKALASAGHVYSLNIPEKLIYMQPAGFALTEVERSNNGK